jgi:hypothetical protein
MDEVVVDYIVVDVAAVAEVAAVDKDVAAVAEVAAVDKYMAADKGDAVEVGVIKAIMMTVYTLLLKSSIV